MNILNEVSQNWINKLLKDNLYSKLEYEDKLWFENFIKQEIFYWTELIEKHINKNYEKSDAVEVDFIDEMMASARTSLVGNARRGKITISRGLLIQLYEIIYSLDYSNIVSDGKNIDNIKKLILITSLRFVIYHEIAHIYYGHIKLKKKWEDEKNKNFKLNVCTLEWDADAFAVTKIHENIRSFSQNSSDQETDLMTKICLSAIHIMFYLYRQENDFNEIESLDHPPCLFREQAILSTLDDLGGVKWEYISFLEEDLNRQFEILESENMKYINKLIANESFLSDIERNWQNVKYQLKEVSLLPIEGVDYTDYQSMQL
jgi:hypothetical protein